VGVRLFVGNLDYSVNEGELREYFTAVGPPSQVALPVDRETGRPRGFAFVEFADQATAEEVIRRFNGQPLKGRPLAISEARARDQSAPRPPRPAFGSGPGPGASPGYAPRPPRQPDFPQDFPRGGGGASGPERSRRAAKGKAKPERGGPKGPIRERTGGRVLDIDDPFDDESVAADFDDVATSKPVDDPDEGNE
jgi:cold-inducible RNA-binding protein